jgi:hypothetical protein
MKRLVEFGVAGGETIFVEVDEPEIKSPSSGSGQTMRGKEQQASQTIEKASLSFESALGKIKPVAEAFIHTLGSLSKAPDEMEVEFGLKLTAEAGAVVAAVGAEVNYKVTLKWVHKETETKSA